MYAQRLDLKDDTEVGKGTCAVNTFQLRMVRGTKEDRNTRAYIFVTTAWHSKHRVVRQPL